MTAGMKTASLLLATLVLLGSLGPAASQDHFIPTHRISGIGVARDDVSGDLLEARAALMIESQTFIIMRDPQALAGAKRITGNAKLQSLFASAARRSGLPATLIEAIAYLESWGDARAESPSGPKGVMQISEATARSMGLKISRTTRYRASRERIVVPGKGKRGKPRYRTVSHRTPVSVVRRDDRLSPDRAIPAAAVYLAGMERKFGGRDWAIFAYHCGQGCVSEMMDIARRAHGIPRDELTVPRMFFSCSPVWNRELYEAILQQMQRDYSPTYYFRVRRAEQLLALYRRDPKAFATLWQTYKSEFGGNRAPHRLAVWLRREDMLFRRGEDIRADLGRRLVKALDRPAYFGYSLQIVPESADRDLLFEASPAALGALTYVAFETRRLYAEMRGPHAEFRPLPVTALVEPEDYHQRQDREAFMHSSGQVFDIDYSGLPPGELECLRFVLNDLGWGGYLGFVEEGRGVLHIGAAPDAREFFNGIFREALGGKDTDALPSRN
jgi:hypothetical protein